MGKIKKEIQSKHKESLTPWLQEFVQTATSTPLPLLPKFLATFPSRWPFPRGDLYHWIDLLNRFDSILETFCSTYKLKDGAQMRDFGCDVLLGSSSANMNADQQQWDMGMLRELGYSLDGDSSLIVEMLDFTQMLLEHCGNRSIYASSMHLNDLLHSTDFRVICAALQVGVQLAKRYQASVKRMGMANRQVHTALLSNHYNIELDRVQQLAQPFVKTPIIKPSEPLTLSTPTASVKSKDKAQSGFKNAALMYANDLCAIAKPTASGDAGTTTDARWNGWGDVKISYYPASGSSQCSERPTLPERGVSSVPSTPTPLRRSNTANAPQSTPRAGRQYGSEDSPFPSVRSPALGSSEASTPGQKSIEIPQSAIVSTAIYKLFVDMIPPDAPKDTKYEVLNRVRVSKALLGSVQSRQYALKARLLAIQNLAYIHIEPTFIEKVLRHDHDEPRRFQLVYQLAELIHPATDGTSDVPTDLQAIALSLLEALSFFNAKTADIFSALNATVNHGVLLYIIRKAVAEMKVDDAGSQWTDSDEWRQNLFSLTQIITMAMTNTTARTTPEIISAGLLDILVEILTIRSTVAERTFATLLTFLDNLIYNVHTAFQTLINANGLEAVTDLIIHEVELAQKLIQDGKGTAFNCRSAVVDYEIPFYQQQNLKWLLKFVHHLMSNAYAFGGNTDRLLRNLVDKSALLGSLREIIQNECKFGSLVWTQAVHILSDFLNNDPTSFAAIFEAGLVQSFLESVTGNSVSAEQLPSQSGHTEGHDGASESPDEEPPASSFLEADDRPHPPTQEMLDTPRPGLLARGILPSGEAINVIPPILNAISLNNAGMKMVVSSRAFDSFFEIFESPAHVRVLETEPDFIHNIGTGFDELARHHPALRPAISNAVLDMIARITHFGQVKARESGWGAKLLLEDETGNELAADPSLADGHSGLTSAKGNSKAAAYSDDVDVDMVDPEGHTSNTKSDNSTSYQSITPYIHAAADFLAVYITNSQLKQQLVQQGAIEILLDLCTSPSLPHEFGETHAAKTLQSVIAQLVESSPIIGLPSLLRRTQKAIDVLQPVVDTPGFDSYFDDFLKADLKLTGEVSPERLAILSNGTQIVKALLNAQSLIKTLYQCVPYSTRTQNITLHPVTVFDYYERLVKSLGPLLRSIIAQEMAAGRSIPRNWLAKRDASTIDRQGNASSSALHRTGVADADNDGAGLPDVFSSATMLNATDKTDGRTDGPPSKSEIATPRYRNWATLSNLLQSLMPTVSPLLQILGKALLSRRGERDPFCKSHHVKLAESLAETILSQLQLPPSPTREHFHYWIIMLHNVYEMLLDRKSYDSRHERQGIHVIAPVLITFKQKGGFEMLNSMLQISSDEISKEHTSNEELIKYRLAVIALRKILELYAVLANGKYITDSLAIINVIPKPSDRRGTEQSPAPTLIVELRMAILPVMRKLWESSLVEKASGPVLGKIMDTLKSISTADHEVGAYKRGEKNLPPVLMKHTPASFPWPSCLVAITQLKSLGYEEDLAQEAVYRANSTTNNSANTAAIDYCKAHKAGLAGSRNPIPEDDTPNKIVQEELASAESQAPVNVDEPMVLDLPADLPPGLLEEEILGEFRENAAAAHSNQETPNPQPAPQDTSGAASTSATTSPAQGSSSAASADQSGGSSTAVPKEDLDEERAKLRTNLIDRCLDVIRAHPDSTYEVSDLMSAVVLRGPATDDSSKQEIGETLVNALMSFAMDEDLKPNGRSIAAYAHLLSLLLQDRSFFKASVGILRENVTEFLRFLQVPMPSTEELAPWIPYILLVFEILLNDDEQPGEFRWKAPTSDDEQAEKLQWPQKDFIIKENERQTLLEAILEILPRVGKEESLAISVLRILVTLTRDRSTAKVIGDKKNLQRLFVMTKQLSGLGSARLSETRISSHVMIILRHVVEDEEIIKQIMMTEIRALLENPRTRSLDVSGYIRQLSHVAHRDPKLFVEVSNDMIKLSKWSYQEGNNNPVRMPVVLKEPKSELLRDDVAPTVRATEDLSIQDVKPSTENEDKPMIDAPKQFIQDSKRPILENPDSVIHFLLCELLNYKEVDDKEPSQIQKDSKVSKDINESEASTSNGASEPSDSRASESKDKKTKASFNTEEHPIFIYRCFLLHCLTELLACYNRTKVEFINFKRSAPLQANTPIKPRSSVLNYLLTDVIAPNHIENSAADSLATKKGYATANQTQNLLVALVSKTMEKPIDRTREKFDYEDEPDLLFVRKFVLDTILKAYKDASTSNEAFDRRYARMIALAEVMHLMMGDKDKDLPASRSNPELSPERSHAQVRRLMYEKGYLGVLTASIADIDLAFPPVKRTIKYILRVLRILTSTAIQLSQSNILPAASAIETVEDDIASATSLSDMEDGREETPDLYRNSALGMLEPGRDMEDDYSGDSEDDDEEMYDDEYGDEMEYDDEPASVDGEENISDDDDEVEGMGHIEGLSGDLGVVEVSMDDDEDEDEDDEDDMSEDEDELESEAMDDMDDRIEIVDDEGNPLDDDGASGWESETEEEDDEDDVDYEGEGQDHLEDAQIHGLDNMDDIDGVQRFTNFMRDMQEEDEYEADNLHAGNPYDEGEDDDEDEEDVDDDYAFDDDYPDDVVPPPNAALGSLGWDTLVVNDGGLLGGPHHHRHRHGVRSPFPPVSFMMGGSRDPLGHFGGMSSLSPPLPLLGRVSTSNPRPSRRALLQMLEEELGHEPALGNDNAPPARGIFEANNGSDFRMRSQRNERPSGNEDGLNPLLRRVNESGRDSPRPHHHSNSFVRLLGGGAHSDSPLSIINDLITSLPHVGRHGGTLQFQITQQGPRGDLHELALPLYQQFREPRPEARRDAYQDPSQAASFTAETTISRWLEEAKMVFGAGYTEKAGRLYHAILAHVVPPAIEREKDNKAKEAERKRKEDEERKKREEQERKAREAKEAEEKAAREKAEAEERERAAAAEAELAAQAEKEPAAVEKNGFEGQESAEAMEGVETAAETAISAQDEPTADQPRVMTTIRGEQVDVTELGIDPSYLEALPEEFREEVIAQTVSQRRSAARETSRGTGQQTEEFQEFLDALPDELRQEIVQQERAEQRRRQREEARRQTAATAGGTDPVAQDMDPASILMTFSPDLREQVLLDQGAELMDSLPADMAAEVRRLSRNNPAAIPRERNPPGIVRVPQETAQSSGAADGNNKPQRKTVVQMLDKSGVATLLRLMFINVKGGSIEHSLRLVFKDVCENKQTRIEVISTLLQILQDGTTDIEAVERSFAHLSIKAKQSPKEKDVKAPQSLKRTSTNIYPGQAVHTSSETSPILIVQQCLDLLFFLAEHDVHVPALFLIEQEAVGASLKRSLSRKGKGKESKAHKFAINSLLALLDRDLVIESSAIMDSLSSVLSRVTMPLLALDRKLKDAAEAIKKLDKKIEGATEGEATTAASGNTTSNENTGITSAPQVEDVADAVAGTMTGTDLDTTATDATQQVAVPAAEASASEAPAAESSADSIAKAQERKLLIQKKIKQYVPPVIPTHNLTLIIKIFVARECSSKTFKETLSTIKNLSLIPGAMDVFGDELATQARLLSETIVVHLEELLPHIEKASTGTEIQGVALAKFSPGAADQNKLLRVLTALDHLFAQKKPDSSDSERSNETKKMDLLGALYRNPTFNALWDRLSACLKAIRQRESLINVATILLPLIESLMVVCKDSAQTESQEIQVTKDIVLSSPVPESAMASLFFTFTEDHRRILNELVRNNPSLMKGTFSHLIKNPKVLEFDNKRNWFTRSVHNKNQTPGGRSFPALQLSVRREHVFHDSFKSLYFKSGDEMKFGKLNIRFHGEEGVDAGGVTREWFQVLARQMFDPNYALFVPVSSDRTTFHPNKLSGINDEHLMFFKFIGRVIGKALYEGRVLDCYFSRAVYKRILGKPVSVKDMESFDPDYYKSLKWMLENDITDIIVETFSVEDDEFGVTRVEDLCEDGRNIPVTEDNKHDYVRLVVEHKLLSSVKDQMENFLKGFHEVIPADLVSIFNEQELELLISGLPDIDVDDWKSNTEYHNYTPSSQQIQWFWRALRSFDKEERAKLLQFVTGTSKVPLNGFKELEGMNGINRFNIHRDYGNKDRLPSSHTCFNQLDLPEYESYDALRQQVLKAITAGSDYFGFA